jgi:hypothetical protein
MGLLSVPLKVILAYHADLQNEAIPESYEYCDGRLLSSSQQDINPGGTYQLPDLRNKYLMGADLTKAAFNTGDYTLNSASGAPGPKGSFGLNSKTLSISEIPAHNHGGGDHGHSLHLGGNTNSSFPTYDSAGTDSGTLAAGNNNTSHISDLSVNNSGTIITTQGGGSSFDTRPRSYGVIYIMKVKI